MLAEALGKLIKDARLQKALRQDDLATRAQVSRAVLSRLEQGRPMAVQSDTLDRLFAALDIAPEVGQSGTDVRRRIARLEQDQSRRERRERHLRLALDIAHNASTARAKVAKARKRVDLWRRNRTCSPFYIDRWSKLLALPPKKLSREMAALGEWEDAMFQNSPWSWLWT